MKKKLFALLPIALCALIFISCSKDDDDDNNSSANTGTFDGTTW